LICRQFSIRIPAKMTKMIVSLVLVLALNMLNDVVCYPAIGPYMPVSNVHEHKQISDEVKAFNDALAGNSPNYARAKFIYMYGAGVSCKSATNPRTLQGFALKNLAGETFHDAFRKDNYMKANFWDTFMLDALNGAGTFAGLDRVKRVTSLKKGVLGLVTYYASHELESAIAKAATVVLRGVIQSRHMLGMRAGHFTMVLIHLAQILLGRLRKNVMVTLLEQT